MCFIKSRALCCSKVCFFYITRHQNSLRFPTQIGAPEQRPGSKLQVKTTIDNGGGRRNSKGTKKVNENGMESERAGKRSEHSCNNAEYNDDRGRRGEMPFVLKPTCCRETRIVKFLQSEQKMAFAVLSYPHGHTVTFGHSNCSCHQYKTKEKLMFGQG